MDFDPGGFDAGPGDFDPGGFDSGFDSGYDLMDTPCDYDAGFDSGYDLVDTPGDYDPGFDTGYVFPDAPPAFEPADDMTFYDDIAPEPYETSPNLSTEDAWVTETPAEDSLLYPDDTSLNPVEEIETTPQGVTELPSEGIQWNDSDIPSLVEDEEVTELPSEGVQWNDSDIPSLVEDECLLDPIEDESIIEPVEDQTFIEPVEDQTLIEPVEDQTLIEPVEDQTLIEPVEDQTLIEPIEDQTFIKPTGDQTIIEPVENQTIIEPTEDESLVEIAEDEAIVVPVEDDSTTALPEDTSDEMTPDDQPGQPLDKPEDEYEDPRHQKGAELERDHRSYLEQQENVVLLPEHEKVTTPGFDNCYYDKDSGTLVITEEKNWGNEDKPAYVSDISSWDEDRWDTNVNNLLERVEQSDMSDEMKDQVRDAIVNERFEREIVIGPDTKVSDRTLEEYGVNRLVQIDRNDHSLFNIRDIRS